MDNPEFMAALKATERKIRIIGRTITSVDISLLSISAVAVGYRLLAVFDTFGHCFKGRNKHPNAWCKSEWYH